MLALNVLILVLLGVVSSSDLDLELAETGTIVVETSNGAVRGSYGVRNHVDSKILYWFRSIPFAEPPVGARRFEPPVPKENWSGILDTRSKPPICIQGSSNVTGSEDCLYLKIFSNKQPKATNKLPVLVWIYGGAYWSGHADFDDHSPDFLLHEDVIVVGIHYRVGFMGFFSLGDEVVPGNNGIRDQVLALKWIKENIRNFGGDPDNIAIWGQSAGAASVAYLLQIEETKGLFSKAILNSGSSLSPWALARRAPIVSRAIAKELDINNKDSKEILRKLKEVNIETLQQVASSKMTSEVIGKNPLQGIAFAPVEEPDHENAIITGGSYEKLQNGQFHNVPIMSGYTSLEGYIDKLAGILRLWLLKYDLNHSLLTPEDLNASGPITRQILGGNIKNRYFGVGTIAGSNERTMRLIADTQFERPIHEAIRLYSQKTKVYAYRFSYQGPLWGRTNRTVDGVGHTEDLGYLFDLGFKGSDQDYLVRNRMVRMWTNFVKTGNPTPTQDRLLQNVKWPANTGSEDLQYLEINEDLTVTGLPNADNMNYWRNMYKNYGRQPFHTF
ncbi:unnamed protein product [Phyllotreta striolata]|uniref:Carboxylic ester hydrolase n=1 Tax=Phyllotreta striolata TaxID=444603 RepID=A0A9N9TKW6_PHYSR|nr:unnamed protein product [Phyllotreta striolata]